jgi:hypothetical protein
MEIIHNKDSNVKSTTEAQTAQEFTEQKKSEHDITSKQKQLGSTIHVAVEIEKLFKLYAYRLLDPEGFMASVNEVIEVHLQQTLKQE